MGQMSSRLYLPSMWDEYVGGSILSGWHVILSGERRLRTGFLQWKRDKRQRSITPLLPPAKSKWPPLKTLSASGFPLQILTFHICPQTSMIRDTDYIHQPTFNETYFSKEIEKTLYHQLLKPSKINGCYKEMREGEGIFFFWKIGNEGRGKELISLVV